VTQTNRDSDGFWDAASWEEIRRRGDDAIKHWIRDQMSGTSVTVVLIGSETSERKYVQYEIEHGWERNSGLIGIYILIHSMKDKDGDSAQRVWTLRPLIGYRTTDRKISGNGSKRLFNLRRRGTSNSN
jgi:hypothetical protein